MDLLSDYKRVVRNNDDISIFYIVYQIMMMVGTMLGPGSILLMLSGAFSVAFKLTDDEAFIVNLIPIVIFIFICFTCKSDHQLNFAWFLTVCYALIMVAVLIGMLVQVADDGWTAPTTLSLIYTASIFIVAGILHPQVIVFYLANRLELKSVLAFSVLVWFKTVLSHFHQKCFINRKKTSKSVRRH